jgi:dTDP-4-amino-4,6-dideoxygalactose transaminase
MTSLTFDRHKGRTNSYDVAKIGLNYRIDEIRSAIGIVQLKKLKKGNSKRKLLTKKYIENFSDTEIKIPFTNQPRNSESAFHILPVLLPHGSNREDIMNELKKMGIQSSIHYPPFWGFTAYKKLFNRRDYPISAQICSRELTLPLYPTMELKKVDEVSSSLINIL